MEDDGIGVRLLRQSSVPINIEPTPLYSPRRRPSSDGRKSLTTEEVPTTSSKRLSSLKFSTKRKANNSSNEMLLETTPEETINTSPPGLDPSLLSPRTKRSTITRMISSRLRTSEGAAADLTSSSSSEFTSPLSPIDLKRYTDRAIGYFNLNPKIGMKFYREKLCQKRESPEIIAKRCAMFLKDTRGLNKTKIGIYLSSDPVVLREYLATFDFHAFPPSLSGVELALRQLVSFFRPPGESQQIDRILEMFADRFAIHCVGSALTKDSIHQIAFVIIILNVTLHNPNLIKTNRLTREEVINNYYKDLSAIASKEEIGELYDIIQCKELKHEDDREDLSGNLFTDPDMSGWLDIRMFNSTHLFPRVQSRWKRRYVILSQNSLYYFKKSTDVDFEGFIPLENVRLFMENIDSPSSGSLPPPMSSSSPKHPFLRTPTSEDAASRNHTPINSTRAEEREDDNLRHPRLSRLVSCPTFSTSQSSLTSNGTGINATRPSAMYLLSSFNSSRDGGGHERTKRKFLLVPSDATDFVKTAKLSKKKRGNGELMLQKNYAVAFKVSSTEEFDSWVIALRHKGLLRSRHMNAVSISSMTSSNRGKNNKILSPKFSSGFIPDDGALKEEEEEEKIEEDNNNAVKNLTITIV